ncbi:unnamed protein product, partial [Discosporangium mesarthrocarpum]
MMGCLERMKPLLLLAVLIFFAGTYFISDSYQHGGSFTGRLPSSLFAEVLCHQRPVSERKDCALQVETALIPVNFDCFGVMRDTWVCEKGKREGKGDCKTEESNLQGCIKVTLVQELRRLGFSEE